MGKRAFFLAIFSTIALLTTTGSAQATEPDLLFGQSHDYSVVMRGNGESIVYARINLTNNTDTPLKSYTFEIPKLASPELVGYQMIIPERCIKYDYKGELIAGSRPCLDYDAPDYALGSYIPENAEFSKLKFTNQGSSYLVELPKPVAANKTTLLVFSYIGKGYVENSLGLFKFNFETLKVPSRIKSAQVAVDVDSDLVLEGQRSKVNYKKDQAASNLSQGVALDSNADSLRGVTQSIGQYGGITKEAKNLAPGETLSVKGKYAESSWRLNLGKITLALVGLLAVILLLVWLSRRTKRKQVVKSASQDHKALEQPAVDLAPASQHPNLADPVLIAGGMASAAVIVVATFVLDAYSRSASNNYSSNNEVATMVMIILLILFYLLAALGPAIWIAATRRNWKALIYVLVWEFGWLLVFLVIYQFGFRGLFDDPSGGSKPYFPDDCRNC